MPNFSLSVCHSSQPGTPCLGRTCHSVPGSQHCDLTPGWERVLLFWGKRYINLAEAKLNLAFDYSWQMTQICVCVCVCVLCLTPRTSPQARGKVRKARDLHREGAQTRVERRQEEAM